MEIIYENKIIEIGQLAKEMTNEKLIILFSKNVPQTLKDYCHIIELHSVNKTIKKGQILYIGDNRYKITAVGGVVNQNLNNIGHITIKFDGSKIAELPGTLYVEEKAIPEITVGTTLKIVEE